jgi:hypothetical protein
VRERGGTGLPDHHRQRGLQRSFRSGRATRLSLAAAGLIVPEVDRIDFMVATEDLPLAVVDCAEPQLNGTSLVDLIRDVEQRQPLGPNRYAGMPSSLLPSLAQMLDAADAGDTPQGAQVLGCSCGDFGCGWVRLVIVTTPTTVTWQDVVGSRFAGTPGVYAAVGPFIFDRQQYEHAVATPGRRSPRYPPAATT